MTQTLNVDVDVEVKGAEGVDDLGRSFDEAGEHVSRLDQVSTGVFERIGQRITDMGLRIVESGIQQGIELVGDSIGLASDKAEAASKVNVLYGDSAQAIVDASTNAATTVGMSSGAYLTAAGDLGNLITNMGITGDEAAGMSTDMLTLAADVGSFNNADPTEVVEAMGAAFRGESEPIRQFGVMIDEASVKQQAMALGLYDGVGALSESARAQATYALILQDTQAAQGDFARTSDGLANQQRIAAAQQEEAWTSLGQALLPIAVQVMPLVTAAIQTVVDVVKQGFGFIQQHGQAVAVVLGIVGTVVLVSLVPPFLAWAAATLAATWPLLALIGVVAGVVAILEGLGILDDIIGLFQRIAQVILGVVMSSFETVSGGVRLLGDIFGSVFATVRGVFDRFVGVIRGGVDTVTSLFGRVRDFLATVFGAVGRGLDTLGSVFGDVFDGIADTVGGAIDAVLGVFGDLWSGIQSTGGSIMRFVGNLFKPLGDSINGAIRVVKDAWNGFARIWNGIGISIPEVRIPNPMGGDMVFGGGRLSLPTLPTFARGGIVTGPTVAMIGEAGPEAVVPLDRGIGATYIVNISTGVGDPVAIGREVVDAIQAFERASGPVFASTH